MKSLYLVSFCILNSLLNHGNNAEIQPSSLDQTNNQGVHQEQEKERRVSDAQAGAQAQAYVNQPPLRPYVRGECYSCVDCSRVNGNTTVKRCPYKQPRCVVYAEKYIYDKEPLYIRGCVLERGSCEDIERAHEKHDSIKLLSCSECVGDRCNTSGGSRSLPDLIAAVMFLVVTPLVTKYALS